MNQSPPLAAPVSKKTIDEENWEAAPRKIPLLRKGRSEHQWGKCPGRQGHRQEPRIDAFQTTSLRLALLLPG